MTHCFHTSSSSALFSSSIKVNLNRLLTFPLTQCSVGARRLEMLQLSHSGCSWLLYLAFIGSKNASTDHKRQISNVVGNGGYNFSGFCRRKPLAGTCGSALWLNRGWCPLVGRDPSEPSAMIYSHHIPPLCPFTSCVPSPFLKILSSWPFSSVPPAVAAFSSPLPPFLPAPRASLPCPSHRGVLQPSTATHTACSKSEHNSQPMEIFPQDRCSTANCEICLLVKTRFAEKLS